VFVQTNMKKIRHLSDPIDCVRRRRSEETSNMAAMVADDSACEVIAQEALCRRASGQLYSPVRADRDRRARMAVDERRR
jgi:hypothetical protein